MELLDRYMFAVGKYLPKNRREDILAELRTNILAMIEEREEELGRPLNLDEQEAVLKQHGHPMLVAARYLPQQHLIGPAVFPFYRHVMKVTFPWVLLVYVVAQCVRLVLEPITSDKIVGIFVGFFPVAFYTAAWITLVFALMEFATARHLKDTKVLYSWKPRNLPVPDVEKEGRTNPIYDFIGSVVTLVFLIVVRAHPVLVLGPGVLYRNMVRPAPVWLTVYEIAIALVCLQLMVKGLAIFSGEVRKWRVGVDLTTKASAIAVISFLIHARTYLVLAPGADTERFSKLVQQLNDMMYLGWKIAIIILVLQLAWELAKLVFPRWRSQMTPSQFLS